MTYTWILIAATVLILAVAGNRSQSDHDSAMRARCGTHMGIYRVYYDGGALTAVECRDGSKYTDR